MWAQPRPFTLWPHDYYGQMKLDLAMETLRRAEPVMDDATQLRAHLDELGALLGSTLIRVEERLPEALYQSVYPLVETSVHLIEAGGKRVRPALVLLSARASGADNDDLAVDLATAGELVHLASLLHDDVIDDAPTRRNVDTPRRVWNNTASVLGGDYALTRALDLVAGAPTTGPLMEAVATLRALVEGELLQANIRQEMTLSRESYLEVIERKTASLFRWCCRAGGHLQDNDAYTAALGDFGGHLGVAFQMVDDVLDYDASSEDVGKELMGDLREGKPTFPLLIALERAPQLKDSLATLQKLDADSGADQEALIEEIRTAIYETGALQTAREIARDEANAAVHALTPLPESSSRQALERIAIALVNRLF